MKAESETIRVCFLLSLLCLGCTSGERTHNDEATNLTLSSQQQILQSPRNTNDILVAIRSVKANPANVLRLTAIADSHAPSGDQLWSFYWRRAVAAEQIGRPEQALEDLRTSFADSGQTGATGARRDIMRELANAEAEAGNFARAIVIMEQALGEVPHSVGNFETLSAIYASTGDSSHSRDAAREAQRLGAKISRSDPPQEWRAPTVEYLVLESEGQWQKAEPYVRESISAYRASSRKDRTPDWVEKRLLHLSSNLLKQGRYDEAEAIDRQVIHTLLDRVGRTNLDTVSAILALGEAVYARDHIVDALRLNEEAQAILDEMKVPHGARQRRIIDHFLGRVYLAQGELAKSLASFEKARAGLSDDDFFAKTLFQHSPDAILALAANEKSAQALALASALVQLQLSTFGQDSVESVEARGIHAYVLARAGRNDEALAEFRVFAQAEENRTADVALDQVRYRILAECYVGVLFDASATAHDANTRQFAEQAFVIAESAREGEVRRAIQAASLRSAAASPQTGDLVRQEQDLYLRAGALRGHLATLSAATPNPQISRITETLSDALKETERARNATHKELVARWGNRGDTLEPSGLHMDAIVSALRPNEALIATFVTSERTFVWNVEPSGALLFRASPAGRAQIRRLVTSVRATTEIKGNTFASIAPFDLTSSYAIFQLVLEPVRSGWEHAHSLIIIPDGPLGFLPFALLPVEPPVPIVDSHAVFDGYRQIQWLARNHASSSVPSAAAFLSLRHAPPVTGQRKNFIGFGDPIFSTAQKAPTIQLSERGVGAIHVRNARVTESGTLDSESIVSTRLENLMPLPETADEVRLVARALNADENTDVLLGKAATVSAARSSLLANRRVIMFATHGLVPGDLDGLAQPALALSNPAVVGGAGDGLLKMDDVLALKLDADWVVLSACNTAAADGAGSEALSGLGRAFFYAGTRALLATHWAVETESAQQITTQLFARQNAEPTLSRAEALQRTMVSMIDGSGRTRDGKLIAAYAHPLFWAPFALFGDGG